MRLQEAIELQKQLNERPNGLAYAVGIAARARKRTLQKSPYFVYVERSKMPPKDVTRVRLLET